MIRTLETIGRAIIPRPVRHRLVRLTRWPPVGHVAFNNLRRTEPVSRAFGGDRGLPIDRYYIEKFLGQHKTDIHGHVLEIGDNKYTRQFGDQRVRYSDILYAKAGHPQATIIAGEGRMLTPIPRDLNLIIMGNNSVAFDTVCSAIIGLDARDVDHIRLSHEHGFGPIEPF